MNRRRRRGKRSGGWLSRRRLLMLLGGSSLLGALISSTGSFSAIGAPRPSDIDTADDTNALLGLSLPPFVDAGESGQELVTITNNTNVPLTTSVSLANASGSVFPTAPTIQPADSQVFSLTLSEETDGGENALTFDVEATDGASIQVNLSRSIGVRNFLRRLEDRTANTNALFYLSYRLQNVDTFDYYELIVRNHDLEWIPDRTLTSSDYEHVFRIPPSGNDGGAAGSTYEFDMRVYDTNGLALQRTLTDVADGDNPSGNDDIGGGPSDPVVVDFTITDEMQYTNADYTVDYELDNTSNLKEVRVIFDNQSNDWADETKTSTSAPTGTVTYQRGGVGGHTYEITVQVVNTNDIVTDSMTKTDVADGDDL